MKKLLLTLATVAISSVASFAATVTDVIDAAAIGQTGSTSTGYSEFTCTGESGATYALQCATNKGTVIQLRSTNSNSGIVVTAAPAGATLSEVRVEFESATASGRTLNIYGANAAYTNPTELYNASTAGTLVGTIVNGTSTNILFSDDYTCLGIRSNSGAIYMTKIEIVWETASATTVTKPAIEMLPGNLVKMTAEAGCTIHYTLDDSEPTTASAVYSAPVAISAKTTVKAIAVNGADKSGIATYVAYPNEVADLAAFITLASPNNVQVNTPVTAIYQNGTNLYLKDAAGTFLLSYNQNQADLGTYNNGDVLASIAGTFKNQNGLPEILPSQVGELTTGGAAVEPETLAIEELSKDMLNAYIRIENVNIEAAANANNYTMTDETGSITLYNTFYNASRYTVVEVPEGEGFTITGFVSIYNNTLQVTPVTIEGGTVIETVATPTFSINGGAVNKGTTVTIACDTPGATIFYTTDGNVPTAASTQYEGAIEINEALTLMAIAVKEGMNDSDLATATFTIIDPNASSVTFDFTNPAGLTPAMEKAADGAGTSVAGQTFTSGQVSMIIGEAATSNPPRLWTASGSSAGTVDLRLYTGDNFKVSIPAELDMYITSIEFTKSGGSFALSVDNGTFTANGNAATWSAAATTEVAPLATAQYNEITFTATATTRMNDMVVNFVKKDSAVNDITVEDNNAPVEYYNLQGVRVQQPTNGLYITRQGNKVSKVVIR